MTQNEYLHEIYRNLNDGKIYGRPVTNVRFSYFSENLYLTDHENIGYQHFGSSAVRNTLRDLNWVLRNIFDMLPEEFCKSYQCRTYNEANDF